MSASFSRPLPEENIQCPIWPDFQAVGIRTADGNLFVSSDRAGGNYDITPEAQEELAAEPTIRFRGQTPRTFPKVGIQDRIRLTSWVIRELMLSGWTTPLITLDVIGSIRSRRHLSIHERADRLLRLIANETLQIGQRFRFDSSRTPITQNYQKALAWSESSDVGEVNFLIDYLIERNFLHNTPIPAGYTCRVTVEGHTEIARQPVGAESNQAFVAMWFDPSMTDVRRKAIEPAIKDAGYDPVIIDQVEHAGLIEDAIIAAIRGARFVVADFTQGDDGARGGVYYEAGFAHGLGLTVIFTCHEDKFPLVHFDTNHYNHILWNTDDLDAFKTKLHDRIVALVDKGPLEFPNENEDEPARE